MGKKYGAYFFSKKFEELTEITNRASLIHDNLHDQQTCYSVTHRFLIHFNATFSQTRSSIIFAIWFLAEHVCYDSFISSDINECEPVNDCMHQCNNTAGSYKCYCNEFFEVDPGDLKACKRKLNCNALH